MSKELEKNIERIEAELKEMKAELEKSKKFEWKYQHNNNYTIGTTYVGEDVTGNMNILLEHGRYRLSKQYAEYSLERNRVANRLEALVEQIEPDYLVPEIGEWSHSIHIDESGKYYRMSNRTSRRIGQVYMSEATATKICELLNSKQVVL